MVKKETNSRQGVIEQKTIAERYLDIVGKIAVALNAQFEITYLNRKGYQILGYSEGELEGKSWETCLPPENRVRFHRVFDNWIKGKTKTPVHQENVVLTKSGNRRAISWYNTELKDERGSLVGILSSGEDITEQKKLETELRESEELYRTLLDSSEEGFILIEPIFNGKKFASDFRFIKANSAYERQIGVKANTLVEKQAKEIKPKIDHSIIRTSGSVVKSKKAKHSEIYDPAFRKWFDVYFFPFGKNQVGALFRDITKSKKTVDALEASEAKLRSIIENSSDQIFMLDRHHRYLTVNASLASILGKTPKDIIGKTISEVYPPETAARFTANIKNVFNTGEAMFIEEKMLAQGQELEISTSLNPVRDSKGRSIAVIGIVRDITQRRKLEKQIQEIERLAAIGQTTAMVGHDIRNPLQAMVSDVYLLKSALVSFQDKKLKQEALESLEDIESSIDYINKIVADLQDYSRTLTLEIKDVNVYELVMDILKSITIPGNIECSLAIDPSLLMKSDPTIVKRILNNLIINAVQAMPDGGKLSLGAYQSKKQMSIEVTDTGVGIPEDVKPKLFTPMMTTKSKGQGLGLAVVKRLVEELNGSIEFESKEHKGSKFTVKLPLRQPSRPLQLTTSSKIAELKNDE